MEAMQISRQNFFAPMHFRLKAECPRYLSNGLQSQICCSSQLLHHDFVQCTDFQSTFQRTLRLSEEHCIAQVKSIVLVCRRQILFQMFEPWSIKIAAQQQKLGLHIPAPIHKFSHWQKKPCYVCHLNASISSFPCL